MSYFNQESERLTYRKLTTADTTTWLDFFKNNDRLHFIGFDMTKTHEELAHDWIQKQIARYVESGFGHLAVIDKSNDELIGLAGIIPRELNDQNYFEIAYSFKPTAWGKGFGTEVAKQMRLYGVSTNVSSHFISIIHIDNKESMHVAMKNEMTPLFNSEFLGMNVTVFGDEQLKPIA